MFFSLNVAAKSVTLEVIDLLVIEVKIFTDEVNNGLFQSVPYYLQRK